ncbi:hypothetical protein PHMEG_00019077, partial [Phytophthora megakarya]
WRLVITDRFYTSVKLALELFHRCMYLTGTISTKRSGWEKEITTKKEVKTVNRRQFTCTAPWQETSSSHGVRPRREARGFS